MNNVLSGINKGDRDLQIKRLKSDMSYDENIQLISEINTLLNVIIELSNKPIERKKYLEISNIFQRWVLFLADAYNEIFHGQLNKWVKKEDSSDIIRARFDECLDRIANELRVSPIEFINGYCNGDYRIERNIRSYKVVNIVNSMNRGTQIMDAATVIYKHQIARRGNAFAFGTTEVVRVDLQVSNRVLSDKDNGPFTAIPVRVPRRYKGKEYNNEY